MLIAETLNERPIQPRFTPGSATPLLTRNKLLLDLPTELQRSIIAKSEHVRLRPRQMLDEIAMPGRHLHFIENGRVSLMGRLEPGKTVEVGVLDHRDLVGLHLVLGEPRTSFRAVVQTSGEALRIPAHEALRLLASIPDLHRQLLRYVNRRFVRNAQTALCNGHHTLHQRVARWLGWATDTRGPAAEIAVTHDQLARDLGVRRATISEILGDLEARGVLRRGRGSILIYPNRIEAEACCCLRIMRRTEADGRRAGQSTPISCS